MLLAGVAASRFGIWLFALAVAQILQEDVAPGEMGRVNGAASAASSTFETLAYAVSLACSDVTLFPWLMLGSLGSVAGAAALALAHAADEPMNADARSASSRGGLGDARPAHASR